MDWGMQNRLARILQPDDDRTVMLAVDHGYFLGPMASLEQPALTIEPLIDHADALMLTRGVLRTSVDPRTHTPIVLRVSGGVSIAGEALENEGLVTSIEDAMRLSACAVALQLFVGTPYERQTILNLGQLVNEGERVGMPVLAVTAVGRELEKREARYLALCCRIAAETGARLVKTYYCDGFDKVAGGCPVPVIIAGGPKMDTELDVFQVTYDALQAGAAGVDMGRNIWQHETPVPMITAIRAIVHDNADPYEALDIFRRTRDEEEARERVLQGG